MGTVVGHTGGGVVSGGAVTSDASEASTTSLGARTSGGGGLHVPICDSHTPLGQLAVPWPPLVHEYEHEPSDAVHALPCVGGAEGHSINGGLVMGCGSLPHPVLSAPTVAATVTTNDARSDLRCCIGDFNTPRVPLVK
jgi:hypothetical protein